MADFLTAFRTRLIEDEAVAAAVGQKIHWGIVPENTSTPYIRLNLISDVRSDDLDGYDGLRQTRVQVDCFSESSLASFAISYLVIKALDAPATVDGGAFGRIQAIGPSTRGEDIPGADYLHWAATDLLVEHTLDG